MTETIVGTVWKALRQTLGRAFRAGFIGLVAGGALVELLAVFLNRGDLGSLNWPPTFDGVYTLFVHIIAGIFGIILGALFAVTTATVNTIRELLNAADKAVDAIDGSERHGLF
jgi:hypothetical protein